MHALIHRLNVALEGRYSIERELGEGGMATVYLADDLKHDRQVALKVLKPELAAIVGADRFLAEIKTTANLQHPHILPLHDSGDADGFLYYVMPYVEGESLRVRLQRERQLPVDEAVRIATSVAEALDYAHRQGVVHRDIKPANILLQDGMPVVADFGIALAVRTGGGHRLTETGLSLGTPHYMSPEQATGDANVRGSTDVYALGCVLYEMLAGEPPYTGSTPQAILGRIITADAPSVREKRSAPAHVDAAIRRALEKIPADRFGSAGEMAAALRSPSFRWGDSGGLGSEDVARWRRVATVSAVAAAVLGVLLLQQIASRSGDPSTRTLRYSTMLLPEGRSIAPSPRGPLSFSADGTRIAVRTDGPEGNELWVRGWADPEPVEITFSGRESGVPESPAIGSVFLSPDGEWLAFHAAEEGLIKRMHLSGGVPETVGPTGLDNRFDLYGLAWGPGGQIVIATSQGLRRFAAPGAPPEDLTDRPGTSDHAGVMGETRYVYRQPVFMPGGEGIVFTRSAGTVAPTRHEIVVLGNDGSVTPLVLGHSPHVTSDGILIFAPTGGARGSLSAVRLSDDGRSLAGNPVPALDGAWTRGVGLSVSVLYAVSDDGTLVYAPEVVTNRARLVWMDRQGRMEPILGVQSPQLPPGININPGLAAARLSPNGQQVAFRAVYTEEPSFRIFVYDLGRGVLSPLTVEVRADWPVWTLNGERLLFNRFTPDMRDVYWARADNAGAPEPYWPGNALEQHPQDFSPDGRYLVYQERQVPNGPDSDLWVYAAETGESRLVVDGPGIEKQADISPDGRWLAFASDISGRDEVYVTEFPASRSRTKISVDGARSPVWSPQGDELFYMRAPDATIMGVDVSLGDVFSASAPAEIASGNLHFGHPYGRAFDVSHDARRFLVGDMTGERLGVGRVEVVDHWLDEVRRRLEG